MVLNSFGVMTVYFLKTEIKWLKEQKHKDVLISVISKINVY